MTFDPRTDHSHGELAAPAPGSVILEIDGLAFSYKNRLVLQNVQFRVRAGELLAILGPNGVGKTTLLKCVNAVHRPSDGTVLVEGADALSMKPNQLARSIGYVAQRAEAARLTVFDAVLMGRKPHIRWRVSDDDLKIVESAVRRLHLEDMSLRFIDELSGGELQKVCIARALVQEPRLLLLDEPTSSLDLRNQMEIMTMVRRVIDEHQVAGVMTMHDMNTALRFADKALFLKDGVVHACTAACDVTESMVETIYGLPVRIREIDGCPVVIPR